MIGAPTALLSRAYLGPPQDTLNSPSYSRFLGFTGGRAWARCEAREHSLYSRFLGLHWAFCFRLQFHYLRLCTEDFLSHLYSEMNSYTVRRLE